jgi:hypothetical protein
MNCKNCDIKLIPDASFCHDCGGKVIHKRLTIKNLVIHIGETFFNYDNKFLQTIINLFTDPKDVIDGYVNGVRKKYIDPLGFFAISLTLSGLYFFLIKNYFPNIFDFMMVTSDSNTQMLTQRIIEPLIEYNSLMYFMFIPLAGLMSYLIFINKHYNFTEHIVIYFYTLPLLSNISIIVNLLVYLIYPEILLSFSVFYFIGFFTYMGYVLTRIFSLSAKQLIIKTLIFLPVFFMVYIIISIAIVILLIVFGGVNLEDLEPPS